MKITFFYVITFLLLFNVVTNAQSNPVLQNLRKLYQEQGVGKAKKTIFYNKIENTIDIDGTTISLNNIHLSYEFEDGKHWIKFRCSKTNNCIVLQTDDENTVNLGVDFNFKTKSACYKFIDLIGTLKSQNQTD